MKFYFSSALMQTTWAPSAHILVAELNRVGTPDERSPLDTSRAYVMDYSRTQTGFLNFPQVGQSACNARNATSKQWKVTHPRSPQYNFDKVRLTALTRVIFTSLLSTEFLFQVKVNGCKMKVWFEVFKAVKVRNVTVLLMAPCSLVGFGHIWELIHC
jgi:hypothetical protein